MKKLIFLNSVLALSLLFQFCTKDENMYNSEIAPLDNQFEVSSDRAGCGCNLQVIANMAGHASAVPWIFELVYIGTDGNPHVKGVTANGTSNHSITINDATSQTWEFTGGGNTSVVNVSARLSCSGDGGKVAGPIQYYTIPANTSVGGVHVVTYSTNSSCDVEL